MTTTGLSEIELAASELVGAEPSLRDLLVRAARVPLTVADLPDDVAGARFELIDGSLIVTPLGDVVHQQLVLDYAFSIRSRLPGDLTVLAGVNVIVGVQTLVEPDVAVVDPTFVTSDGLGVSPQGLRLAVEVTSPSTRRRDLSIKRELYREWGVPYLVVDRSTQPFTLHVDGDLPAYAVQLVEPDAGTP
jgi:Uma2 family endonuclease